MKNRIVFSITACLVGCASYPAPTDHLANSYASIRAAQEVGATASPQAALYLKLAQEEQAKAKGLVAQDENEKADSMTMRANADAELAMTLARVSVAHDRTAGVVGHAAVAIQQSQLAPSTAPPVTATTSTTSVVTPVSK